MTDGGTGITGAVHSRLRHDSAVKHVTGAAVYIDDLPVPPGTLEAALVLSPHAHARIRSIGTAAAAGAPGVATVMTAADVPGANDVAPVFSGEPVLASGTAEYAGQPVAAVAADTRDRALAAAGLVEVDYERLDPVLSIEEAWERGHYTCPPAKIVRGDAEAAIAAAAHTVSGELRCGGQDHFYLEGQIALAIPGEDRDMTVVSSTQHPTEVQHGVSRVLGVPLNAVTVEVRRMGGAFGGKESQATIIAAAAALLAGRCGLPVKLRLGRDDDMTATGKRHDFLFRYELGFDGDGRIEGAVIDLAARSGNVADLTGGVMARALCHADNAYYIPNALFRGWPCKTNTVSNTAFRGFGGPQGMLVIETALEHVAHRLGKSLDEVRAVNWYGTHERNVTPYGQPVTDNVMPEIVARLVREAGYEARREAVAAFNESHGTLKKGIALMPVKFGISFNVPALNQAGALVHVYTDGSVHLNHGGTEMGQGLFTKVAQVVASTFRIDVDHVKVSATRTDKVPNTSATAASAGSDLNGMAAFQAAETIRTRMAAVAAGHFEVAPGEVEFRRNRVYAGNESLSFAEVARMAWSERVSLSAAGYYRTPDLHWDAETMTGSPFYYFTYGACIAEVAIDTLTGESRVLSVDILQDCGASLNPEIDLGQIEGAFVQGMGWLTSEELVWDREGRLMTHGPSTYKIPGSRDVPPRFKVHILEDAPNRAPTIFRSKAVGEPPLMLAIAVWLAIRDAVGRAAGHASLPRLDAPATPEAILAALDGAEPRAAARGARADAAPHKTEGPGRAPRARSAATAAPRKTSDPPPANGEYLLEALDVVKRFGDFTANDGVTLRLRPGEIHALLGENGAGKSTLVKIVYGALQPTAGRLRWCGEPVTVANPAAARRLGIGMVFQHFSLFEALSVAENIALALPPGPFDLQALGARIARVSAEYGLALEPTALVADLSVGERQRIEIVRCLLQEPRLLIMDEPTAVLTPQEAEQLFVTLRRLADEGCSVLYISHRLAEVQRLCHDATILRHGKVVANVDPQAETAGSLARLMVGAQVHAVSAQARAGEGPVMLAASGLALPAGGPFGVPLRDVSIEVRAGEVVAVAGVAGNGQSELFEALSGERLAPAPEAVHVAGVPCGTRGVTARRRLGAAFVPEERLGHSAVPGFVLSENVLLTQHACDRGMVRAGFVDRPETRAVAGRVNARFDVRTSHENPEANALSGGNLQKFVVGRELDRAPRVVVIDQPTWGVDAGAAALIRQALVDMARAGAAVLVVSQDLDEIFEIADRIAVISRGELSEAYPADAIDRERIGLLMAGAHEAGAAAP